MGLLFAKLWSLFGNEEHKIVIVGLDNAGKTTILYQFLMNEVVHTSPTIGSNVEEVVWRNLHFIMWDLGGQQSLRAAWSTYYSNTEFVIVVVDSTDRERLSVIREELYKMLAHEELSKAGVLVYANKQDVKGSMSASEISKELDLTSIKQQQWHIQSCCALTGEGISIELSPNSNFNSELLVKLAPQFISVTWLGTTYLELPNHEIPAILLAKELCNKGFPVMMHLAGRNLKKERAVEILGEIKNAGVKNILALQGDWSYVTEKDDSKCDFPYAVNLVSFIKEHFGDQFCIGVAGYPDGHPHSQNIEDDIKFLRQKVIAGADFIVTQAAFDYESLEKFAKICKHHQISVPIVAGIFIIKSYISLINMAKWCGFQIPKNVLDFVNKNQDQDDIIEKYGLDLAANLIRKVLTNKDVFAGVHIFSMNNMEFVEKAISKV